MFPLLFCRCYVCMSDVLISVVLSLIRNEMNFFKPFDTKYGEWSKNCLFEKSLHSNGICNRVKFVESVETDKYSDKDNEMREREREKKLTKIVFAFISKIPSLLLCNWVCGYHGRAGRRCCICDR